MFLKGRKAGESAGGSDALSLPGGADFIRNGE